jgi:beta-xylosidase
VEGPSALRVGDDYLIYFDFYRAGHYGAARSRDLTTWEDVSALVSFPKGTRHGAALAVEGAVVSALLPKEPS